MPIDEVDHVSAQDPIERIAERAAQHQRERNLQIALRLFQLGEIDEDEDDGPERDRIEEPDADRRARARADPSRARARRSAAGAGGSASLATSLYAEPRRRLGYLQHRRRAIPRL